MSSTTNIPRPDGATADEWQHDPELHRVVHGQDRTAEPDTFVGTAAVQLGDGRLDDGSVFAPPVVLVNDQPYTVEQARALAALILDAAAELDRWTAVEPPFV